MNNKSEFERAVYQGEFRILIGEERLSQRIMEMGRQITEDYRGKQPIFIGVLNGAFLFMADLIRNVELDIEVDFIKISSYGDEKVSSGKVLMLKDINAEIKGRHIVVVEDIVDTGLSIQFLREKFLALSPASLRFVSLLYKRQNVQVNVELDYVGFEIPDEFVIGYGLDYKQKLRNLPAVYVMD